MGWLSTDKQQRQPKIDVPAGAFTAGGSFASRLSVHVHQPTLGVYQTPQLRASGANVMRNKASKINTGGGKRKQKLL
jgi:hypothetical protein